MSVCVRVCATCLSTASLFDFISRFTILNSLHWIVNFIALHKYTRARTHTQTVAHWVSSHIAHISLCCLSVSGFFIVIESLRHVFHFRLLHATPLLPLFPRLASNLSVSSWASHTLPCLSFGHITFYCPLYLPQYASNMFDYRATYALPQRGVLLQYQQLGWCGCGLSFCNLNLYYKYCRNTRRESDSTFKAS